MIVDLFKSIQGEGMLTGTPSIFIRTTGCNLRCMFKNSICDTPYTSFEPEKGKYTLDDCKRFIMENPKIGYVVITGGEPLLYRDKEWFIELLRFCKTYNKIVTIETNGTLPPVEDNLVDLYSVSLKLDNSDPLNKTKSIRLNIDCIKKYFGHKIQLKFVYSDKETISMIEDLYEDILRQSKVTRKFLDDRTVLMPEGIDIDHLRSLYDEIVDVCLEKGWRMTDRLHIRIFGNKRAV